MSGAVAASRASRLASLGVPPARKKGACPNRWAAHWSGAAAAVGAAALFPVPFGGSPSGVDLVASAALCLSL